MIYKVATRKSKLAQLQAEIVMDILNKNFNIASEKLLVETEGDKRLDVTLDKIGGKGLFVKEIEMALIEKKAEIAVHSMKDVPFQIEECFSIAAMPVREDARDVFISGSNLNFHELPKGSKVGTSSKRRVSQLAKLRPDLEFVPVRGNVQTRIDKIKREGLGGIILAAAGVKRLGLEEHITNYFSIDEIIPAVGQGALGVETLKASETEALIKKMDCKEVRVTVEAERSFMRKLNGGCHTTVGAYATIKNNDMYMVGVFEVNGKIVKKDILGSKFENIALGEKLADKILK